MTQPVLSVRNLTVDLGPNGSKEEVGLATGEKSYSQPNASGGDSGPGAAGASPDVKLKIGDRRRRVRAGKKVKYTLTLRNLAN